MQYSQQKAQIRTPKPLSGFILVVFTIFASAYIFSDCEYEYDYDYDYVYDCDYDYDYIA